MEELTTIRGGKGQAIRHYATIIHLALDGIERADIIQDCWHDNNEGNCR
jgi:hypothetical protein